MTDQIGKVTATEGSPTTTTNVTFWVEDSTLVRPFDIVKIRHVPGFGSSEPSWSYAIIQELAHITDSPGHLASYVSSDFGDVDVEPRNARLGTTVAKAEVLYNTQEVEMPLREGASVLWADPEGVKEALGIANIQRPIPAGFLRMSNGLEVPVSVDADYLIGPEGAHLNIAGISGLATKTTYSMFLLNSIQQLHSSDISIIVFNVKGRDLLAIDTPVSDDELPPGLTLQRIEADWERCGLKATPFRNVTYLYPYSNDEGAKYTSSHVDRKRLDEQIDRDQAFNYFYDAERGLQKLELLFSDPDPNHTLQPCIDTVRDWRLGDWAGIRTEVAKRTQAGSSRQGQESAIPVVSWRRFSRLLKLRTSDRLFATRSEGKARRMKSVEDAVAELKPGRVLVIDIEPLPPHLQALVVGDVVHTILGIKLGDDLGVEVTDDIGRVVVFADELNKFAPRFGREEIGAVGEKFREIAARGRSMGMVLFGAEQFRSGVDEQILGNCSTNVFGRTSPVEIAKGGDYRYMSKSNTSSIIGLSKGNLMLQHAIFRTNLIKVSFPFPFYHHPKK